MKFIRYINIFFFTTLIVGLTCCTDDLLVDQPAEGIVSPGEEDDMVEVTLKFNLDPSIFAKTRAGEGVEVEKKYGLENLDVFIYVLRDSTNKILYQYGKGYVDPTLEDEPAFDGYSLQADNNQTIMRVKWIETEEGSDGSGNISYKMEQDIKLRVMRNTVFKLSCWTQSSKSTAYDFNYLTALKVNYEKMTANSEINDAFCATSIFSIGQMNTDLAITLTRPFAQINVGVDESILDDDNALHFGTTTEDYKYSMIELNGIAVAFDVIKNKVWSPDDIKIYKKYQKKMKSNSESVDSDDPQNEDDSQEDEEDFPVTDNPYYNYSLNLFDEDFSPENAISDFKLPYSPLPGFEEIKDNDGKVTGMKGELDELTIYDFSNWGPNSGTDVPRKTYKKLAMAYVLVPEAANSSSSDSDSSTSSSVSTIELKEFKIDKDNDKENTNEKFFIPDGDKKFISVRRNWRTNLLFTDWDWVNKP